ncbi:MAG: threonine synthase [Phycisphaeraceae bacterium]|nr:threonine synthase [Phycisphaeraceae bacterium]
MSIWRWAEYFSETPTPHQITLGEGNTPLLHSRKFGSSHGLKNLYFKLESTNPTGSYKDRFAAAAISNMVARGMHQSIGTSSGNTGSAVAAYCAAAQIDCHIAIVETAPAGKLKQMLAYGAHLYRVRGMGSDPKISDGVITILRQKADAASTQLQISAFRFCRVGMEGVKTISYELNEQCHGGRAIDHVFVQAGGGGLTLAIAEGFEDLIGRSLLQRSPAVHCVQPEGNDTMAGPLRNGLAKGRACQCTSEVSGLQVPWVIDADEVIPACRATGGTGHLVSDTSVWAVQKQLALEEGIFCEPAGATALAGAVKALQHGDIKADDMVVCIITGIGFKDDAAVDRMIADRDCPLVELSDLASL